jgi:hypothetical protein
MNYFYQIIIHILIEKKISTSIDVTGTNLKRDF